MKQQSVGIVLCALLLTTFGHDILNSHHFAHSARLAHRRHEKYAKQGRDHASTDSPDGQVCKKVCYPDGNLTITVNTSASLLVVYNASAHIALVVDVKANLVGIFNLTTTGGVIINLKTQVVVEVTGVWEVNVEYEKFVSIIISRGLQVIASKGKQISVTQIQVLVQWTLVILSLGEYHVSAKDAVGVLIQLSSSLVVSFNIVIRVIATQTFSAAITLSKVVELVGGLANVVTNIQGGIEVFIKYKIILRLEIVLQSSSSLQITGYIWEQFGANADLEAIFNLRSSSDVLKLIASLGGNSTKGVNGLVTVLLEVLLIVHGKGSLDTLITVLIEYFSSSDHKVGEEWKAAIDRLYDLIIKLKLQVKLRVVYELVVKIRESKWVEENVNISAILKALVESHDHDALNVIAVVLVLLKARIQIELAIATLVVHFFELLLLEGGVGIFVFITGVEVGAEIASGSVNVLAHLLRGINIVKIITAGVRGFIRVLSQISVFGKLFIKINVAFKAAGATQTVEGSFNFSIGLQIFHRIIIIIRSGLSGGSHPLPIHIPISGPGPVHRGTVSAESSNESEVSKVSSWTESYEVSQVYVSGGHGGSGGDGGSSSGNATSVGNSGNVNGGGHAEGNLGGNIKQVGGGGGTGGAGGGGNKGH